MKKIFAAFKSWYTGQYEPYVNEPGSGFIRLGGVYRKHWTSTIFNALVKFYLDHWKWIWPFVVAVITLAYRSRICT